MNQYFNINHLKRNNNMLICRALLKHGHINFSLEILKYGNPAKCSQLEQFYLDLLKPEYNILKLAGSSLGFKHSEITRKIMSEGRKGKIHSEETRAKMSDTHKGTPKP
jgi:group I intron endonuclease